MTNQKQSAADIAEGHELNRQLWDVISNMLDEPYLVPLKAILIKVADMHRQAINASVHWSQQNGGDEETAGEDRRLSKPSLQVREGVATLHFEKD